MHPAPRQVELAIFAEAHQTEISVTDIQSGRADVYGHGAICIHTHIYMATVLYIHIWIWTRCGLPQRCYMRMLHATC